MRLKQALNPTRLHNRPPKMRHPVQRLHFCPSTNRLFAGVGGSVQCFHGSTGDFIAEWTAPQLPAPAPSKKSQNKAKKAAHNEQEEEGGGTTTPVAEESNEGSEGSPCKKRKVGEEKAEPIRSSMLGVGAPRREGENGKNSVTKLLSVKEGTYLVVITNEDKTVRVLEVTEDGMFRVLSERAMPKRPCAVSMTDSDSTILLADKFGDVYALPLLPPSPEAIQSPAKPQPTEKPTPDQLAKEERERLAEVKRKRTEISHDLPFTARLLLGHVSMLVDVLAITLPDESGKDRTYVLTADRDEHIRVSRYPQSFVIEGFCLGHKAFVSNLLAPSWDRAQLVSGGGDEFLLRWDWRCGKMLQKMDVAELVKSIVGGKVSGGKHDHGGTEKDNAEKEFKVTVVGIWEVPELKTLVVAFESVPALFVFTLNPEITHTTTLPLSGHPLDAAVDTVNSTFYVSIVQPEGSPTIEGFTYATGQWENVTEGNEAVKKVVGKAAEVEFTGDEKILNEGLLYATGFLRKGTGRTEKE